jgi:nitroreductase
MELLEAVQGRRSATRVTDPAPTDDEICELLASAATGPDHGLLRPWRVVLVRGAAREALGAAFAADLPTSDAAGRERAAAKPLRAPLLMAIVCAPEQVAKVPDWEQMAATAVAVYGLMLLLHERHWGSIWRTGEPSRSVGVRALLGVGDQEQLLGWLYIGTQTDQRPPDRPSFDPRGRVFTLGPDRTIRPLTSTATVSRHGRPYWISRAARHPS